jgi:hypothetical protein
MYTNESLLCVLYDMYIFICMFMYAYKSEKVDKMKELRSISYLCINDYVQHLLSMDI